MKFFFITSLISILFVNINAQRFAYSIHAGTTYSSIRGKDIPDDTKPAFGLMILGSIEGRITPLLLAKLDMGFEQKGYFDPSPENVGHYQWFNDVTYRFNYFAFKPSICIIVINKPLEVLAKVGSYYDLLINITEKGIEEGYDPYTGSYLDTWEKEYKSTYQSYNIKPWEIGVFTGFRIGYPLANSFKVFANIDYSIGFTTFDDSCDNGTEEQMHNSLGLSLGLLKSFGK